MTNNREIQVNLTLSEINKILDALGNLPYREVFQLVGKIQTQAESQLEQETPQLSNSESEIVDR